MATSIHLRNLSEADLDTYLKWKNDPEVTKYLARTSMSEADARAWLREIPNRNPHVYGVEHHARLVGYAIIENIDATNKKCEVGVVIGDKDAWGKGVGRAVARELSRIAIKEFGLHRVLAVTSAENMASIRCFKAAGFQEEGRLRDGYFRDGRFIDLVLLSLLATDFDH